MPKKHKTWLVACKLKTEQAKDLKDEIQKWLAAKRSEIWYALKYKFGALPLDSGEWLIRDNKDIPGLHKQIKKWIDDYKEMDIPVSIAAIPLSAGIQQDYFDERAGDYILGRLNNIQRDLSGIQSEKGNIDKRQLRLLERELEIIKGLLNEIPGFKRRELANDLLSTCDLLIFEVAE